MERQLPYPAEVLLARLTKSPKQPPRGRLRLGVGVDVAQRAAKADVQSNELASVAPFRIPADTQLRALPHRRWDVRPARVWVTNPDSTTNGLCHSVPPCLPNADVHRVGPRRSLPSPQLPDASAAVNPKRHSAAPHEERVADKDLCIAYAPARLSSRNCRRCVYCVTKKKNALNCFEKK